MTYDSRIMMLLGMVLVTSLAAQTHAVQEQKLPPPHTLPGWSAPEAVLDMPKRSAPALRMRLPESAAIHLSAAALEPHQLEQFKRAQVTDPAADIRKIKRIGGERALAGGPRTLQLAKLAAQPLDNGGRVAGLVIDAPGAAGLRVEFRVLGSPASVRFAGARDEVYGSEAQPGEWQWSPVLEGDKARLEFEWAAAPAADTAIEVRRLSHLFQVGADFLRKRVGDIGDSGSCNIDLACVNNPSAALLSAARAVAKMVFTRSTGETSLCSGTLLNTTPQSNVPYFLTAAHCIDSQAEASTLNTYWFFDAVACRSQAIPSFQLVTGGAALLVADPTTDVTLLRLNQSPPPGATLAAWNATVVPRDSTLIGLHHPSGDLKKFSQGSSRGYVQGPPTISNPPHGIEPNLSYPYDSYIEVIWSDGTTEGGSSGSGVFTFNGNVGAYELRGALNGGSASCGNPSGRDRYGRLDLMFAKLAPYIAPGAIPPLSDASRSTMIEYYNAQFDYYFMTSSNAEKGFLDTFTIRVTGNKDGRPSFHDNPPFYRTGYWFRSDTTSSSQTQPLIRYFMRGAARGGARGSHFYISSPEERAVIANTGKEVPATLCESRPIQWFCNEGIDSYVYPPIGGACTANEFAVARLFKGPPNYNDDGNHRFVIDAGLRAYMRDELGWADEGVKFCVPR